MRLPNVAHLDWRLPAMASDPRSENLARVLDISRATLDAEFQRANRWDEKARGQATLAGAWLAVTQAVAAVALGSGAASGWVLVAAAGLVLQAGALVEVFTKSAVVWRPRERGEFGREALEELEGRMTQPAADMTAELLAFYKNVLDGAQIANEERGKSFEKAMWWWWWVLGIGIVELGIALISRIN
jgi:hypothetical protein